MFDKLEIRKDNQDMAMMRLIESAKNGVIPKVFFSKSMDEKDVKSFVNLLEKNLKELGF